MRVVHAMPIVNAVVEAANNLTAPEKAAYGLTTQTTELNAVVKDFNMVLTLPRDKVVVRANSPQKLKELYKETEDLLIDEMDNIMMNFEGSDFFNEYEISRRVLDKIKHTVIALNVTNEEGIGLNKVAVKLTGRDKVSGG